LTLSASTTAFAISSCTAKITIGARSSTRRSVRDRAEVSL